MSPIFPSELHISVNMKEGGRGVLEQKRNRQAKEEREMQIWKKRRARKEKEKCSSFFFFNRSLKSKGCLIYLPKLCKEQYD